VKPNAPMLTGIRVLDLCQIVAGPTCTRMMAELGAEVIKVELPPGGDRTRAGGLKPLAPEYGDSSQSTYFFQHNHSKKSLVLDFRHPRGREVLKTLIARTDVLVENFTPGVMARAGLTYEALRPLNPGLIMCSISLAGQTGPLSRKPGYDYVAQAYAGVTDLVGEPGGSPALITMAIGDFATGLAAAMAIGFALLHRERTGEGQYIEASLLDTYFNMHEVSVPRVSLRGPDYTPTRSGSQHPDGGPTGIFRYADGQYLTLAIRPHQWGQLVRALGMPELESDPRFCTARARRDNNEALKRIIEAWLSGFASREQALEALEKERIPCAPVLTLREAASHPHLQGRRTVRRVRDPHLGEFEIPGMPVKFSRWPEKKELAADLLGAHNEELLRTLAGLSETSVRELYDEGVVARDPLLEGVAAI